MADRLTAEQETAIRTAEAKATAGPWMGPRITDHFPPGCWGVYLADDEGEPLPGEIVVATGYGEECAEDARFIALARNAMPALLAELDAVRAEKAELRAQLEKVLEIAGRLQDIGERSIALGKKDPFGGGSNAR